MTNDIVEEAARLMTYRMGHRAVLVNGVVVIDSDQSANNSSGRLLRWRRKGSYE